MIRRPRRRRASPGGGGVEAVCRRPRILPTANGNVECSRPSPCASASSALSRTTRIARTATGSACTANRTYQCARSQRSPDRRHLSPVRARCVDRRRQGHNQRRKPANSGEREHAIWRMFSVRRAPLDGVSSVMHTRRGFLARVTTRLAAVVGGASAIAATKALHDSRVPPRLDIREGDNPHVPLRVCRHGMELHHVVAYDLHADSVTVYRCGPDGRPLIGVRSFEYETLRGGISVQWTG